MTGTNSNMGRSGEGTRPSTSGGVDNMGGADSFTPGQADETGATSPAPEEKMAEKRQGPGSDSNSDSSPQSQKLKI